MASKDTEINVYVIEHNTLNSHPFDNDFSDIERFISEGKQIWIDIRGLSNHQLISNICSHFGVHSLIVNDIFYPAQRNKIEILDNYVFCVIGMMQKTKKHFKLNSQKFNLIVFQNLIITIGEHYLVNEYISIEKISKDLTKLSNPRVDYLLYLLLNSWIGHYCHFIEQISEGIEKLEDAVFDSIKKIDLRQIYLLKRKILMYRKLLLPIADMADLLCHGHLKFFNKDNKIYFMNLYEQASRTIQSLDFYQQLITNIYDVYLSSTNNTMNQSVTTMTQYAIIFLPLSLITSFFGMNLDSPIFHYKYIFPTVLTIMTGLTYLLYRYLRPKKIKEF